jgi:hypothetical protein
MIKYSLADEIRNVLNNPRSIFYNKEALADCREIEQLPLSEIKQK